METDFPSLDLPTSMDTSAEDLVSDFFVPVLSRSSHYDRGVGYFSSAWLRAAAQGLIAFAERGGRARWITSPILTESDWNALKLGVDARTDRVLKQALQKNIAELERELEVNTLSALAWMVADGMLEFRLALPRNKLTGEFHDKFGIFEDAKGNRISFNGSYNDSVQGLLNYESIKIFCSWKPEFTDMVQVDSLRFEKLWNNRDINVQIFDLPEAAREQILRLRKANRPYQEPEWVRILRELKLPNPLRPYQWNGIRFLIDREGALLADEMGLGKTVQVSVALQYLLRKGDVGRCLVVCPASLKANWEMELRRWAPGYSVQQIRGDTADRRAYYRLPISMLVASYEEVRADVEDMPADVIFDVVILDEAQRIKNPDSQTALACRMLRRERSWTLTGTPVENRVNDLISIFRFVKGGVLHQALSRREMHSRIRPHFLRRRKEDVVAELPPIIEQETPLELHGKQLEAYLQAWGGRWGAGPSGLSEVDLLAIITKLKQLCNYDPESGESAKLEALHTILDGQVADNDKVIVFSQYVETLKWLSRNLADIPHDLFYGQQSPDVRERVLEKFRQEPGPRLLLMSLRAGGVGLNIQEASTVVLFDRWWNPAVEDQAIQRAHRLGRTRPLHAIRFIVLDTIEERIAAVLDEKRDIFESYVEAAESADTPGFDRETLQQILEAPKSA